MPNNTSRRARKQRRARREPSYLACLLTHGAKPNNWQRAAAYKREIIEWWMDSIKSTPQPETDRSGHRFYARFMSWYHSDGKAYLTTVVKEQENETDD